PLRVGELLQRLLQAVFADVAPRADHVRPHVDDQFGFPPFRVGSDGYQILFTSFLTPPRAWTIARGLSSSAGPSDSVKPTGVGSTSRPSPVRPSSPVPRDGSRC